MADETGELLATVGIGTTTANPAGMPLGATALDVADEAGGAAAARDPASTPSRTPTRPASSPFAYAAAAVGTGLALFAGYKALTTTPKPRRRAEPRKRARERPLAVVTGGSSGIGFELARQFATNGYDVLIAAEDAAHLVSAEAELSITGGKVDTHAADLATEAGVDSLYRAIVALGRPVDALCVNAGVGLGGAFTETDLNAELRMIDLNVRGAVQLTKLVVRDMVGRGEGRILFTSSIAATMPDPFEAVYGATKVFLRSFGEALRNELKDSGVSVTVLMPSVTGTNFFRRADMVDTRAGSNPKKDDPAVVAKAGFDALHAGKDRIVPLFKNKVVAAIADTLPDPVAAQVHRGMAAPGTAER